MLANSLWTMFSLARPVCVLEKTLLDLFEKTSPAVSEEGLTNVLKQSLVACACEWLVDFVQLSSWLVFLFSLARGLYLRENSIGHVGENLAGRVRGRLDDCVQERSCCLCLRKALAVSRDFA